jgi:hypothetical protein
VHWLRNIPNVGLGEKIKYANFGNRDTSDANKAAAVIRDADVRPILEAMRDRPLREIAMELTNRNIPTPRRRRCLKRLGIAGR